MRDTCTTHERGYTRRGILSLNLKSMSVVRFIWRLATAFALATLLSACSLPPAGSGARSLNLPPAFESTRSESMDALTAELATRRVVYIGETHVRQDHHDTQLALIKALYAQNPSLAIGVEFFQQPFQRVLDDFIAGRIDEGELLEQSGYFSRWRYDYRLYQGIMQFARDNGIPIIGLNVPGAITHKVAVAGIDSLNEKERQWIPANIQRDIPGYRDRLANIYAEHPESEHSNLEFFIEAQLVWDESMAARAAVYLGDNPASRMVILAGSGHLAYGQGIPVRLERRIEVSSAIVLSLDHDQAETGIADFVVHSEASTLPRNGLLGVILNLDDGRTITGFGENSPAQAAGFSNGDRIVAIDGVSVATYSDIRLRLNGKAPGVTVHLTVRRGETGQFAADVKLH